MLGIYGGTFDPVHNGHLRAAFEVKESLSLEEVWLLPSHQPPHRDAPEISAADRLMLLRAAIRGSDDFLIDARELERGGPSYTFDTLSAIRAEVGARPVGLILGMDAFLGLPGWHRWRELFDLAHLIVMQRPAFDAEFSGELLDVVAGRMTVEPELVKSRPAGFVFVQPVTQLDISATRIRHLLKAGRSPRYLIPDDALEIILARGFYRSR
jgi:nicotinate-nucleotide adenylyltransferase